MNDKEFSELQLRMMIVPNQVRWPAPEYLHWQRLHEAANEARKRVSKAYMQMDEIDCNADLSREGKERQRRRIAAQAVADLEASKTLARAREAVRHVVERWKGNEQHVSPEIAEARDVTLKAMKEAEEGCRKAINTIVERAGRTKGPNMRW
jgi:SpoVK/Ycf46/Vps4 family AAA+-type ATPase